jgi:hypothetical protein
LEKAVEYPANKTIQTLRLAATDAAGALVDYLISPNYVAETGNRTVIGLHASKEQILDTAVNQFTMSVAPMSEGDVVAG